MENMFDQSRKMMDQAQEQWRKMIGENPLWPKSGDQMFQENMAGWMSTMSSAFDANMDAWNSFMEKNQELFFKMYKDSPFYNEAIEERMKESWDNILKAQKQYQDMVKDGFGKLEGSIKESQASSGE